MRNFKHSTIPLVLFTFLFSYQAEAQEQQLRPPAFERQDVTNPASLVQVNQEALDAIREGENTIAAHYINTGGLAYLDVGLVEELESEVQISNARQTEAQVTATQTQYTFDAGSVELELTFTAPLLPDKLNLISRPANYVTFKTRSILSTNIYL